MPIYSLEKEELGGRLCYYLVMPFMEEGDLQTVLIVGTRISSRSCTGCARLRKVLHMPTST